MMATDQHPLVTAYLQRLRDTASGRLPADRIEEIVADLRDDLAERVPAGATEAQIRTALDRLGSPEDIVEAAGGTAPAAAPARRDWATSSRLEPIALTLLIASVLLTVLWPIALLLLAIGFVLAMMSTRWSTADKVLASITYVACGPLGIGLAGLVAFSGVVSADNGPCVSTGTGTNSCASTSSGIAWGPIVAGAALLALHLYTAIRLARHARRARPTS